MCISNFTIFATQIQLLQTKADTIEKKHPIMILSFSMFFWNQFYNEIQKTLVTRNSNGKFWFSIQFTASKVGSWEKILSALSFS